MPIFIQLFMISFIMCKASVDDYYFRSDLSKLTLLMDLIGVSNINAITALFVDNLGGKSLGSCA
ncbi:hypothetical protein [uncultured Shewanella sp.]|uniref:hypothetical protein n=1 Tax=uncultured Shewanella sp. TaxID=173975 RepID=UPI002629EB73|nr:hypothetical protein [uncultured Shewanella sp.]